MAASNAGVVDVRPYRAADEAAVKELLDATFEIRVDATWRETADDGPDVSPLVLERDGVIGGFVRLDAVPVWIERERQWLLLAGDFVVAPELRDGRAALRLADEVSAVLERSGAAALVGFPRQPFAQLLERRHGVVRLGRIPQWVHWADVRAVERSGGHSLAAPARAAIGALARGTGLAVRLSGGLDASTPSREELDDLAARSAGWATVMRVRDDRHLHDRWLARPRRSHVRAHRRGGQLAGVAVFRVSSRRGVAVGRIVDVLAGDARSLRTLIAGVTHELRDLGCDTVLVELLDRRRWVGPTLRSCGFVPRGIGPMMIVAGTTNPVLTERANWYLTRGDTDLG